MSLGKNAPQGDLDASTLTKVTRSAFGECFI
jgi:hypothetical protein